MADWHAAIAAALLAACLVAVALRRRGGPARMLRLLLGTGAGLGGLALVLLALDGL